MSYDPVLGRTMLERCREQVFLADTGQLYSCEGVEHHPEPHWAAVAYGASSRRLEWYLPPAYSCRLGGACR